MNQRNIVIPLRLAAAAVALLVLFTLARPAFSLEQTVCGLQEHRHGDTCFSAAEHLACRVSPHSHGDACRDETGENVCGLADFLLHMHSETCLDAQGQLQCPLPEIAAHSHEESCFAENGKLVCAEEEILAHTHTEACYAEGVQICGLQEILSHTHGEACFETEQILTCTLPEHSHEDTCRLIPETEPEETQCVSLAEAPVYTADAREDDLPTVSGGGIRFRLFNYSQDINKAASKTEWRPISDYFTFRNSHLTKGDAPSDTVHIPAHNINADQDADGFTATHATVERNLRGGVPVLDLSRNADGTARNDPGVSADTRSLAYLFRDTGDHAVTVYSPENTILQKSGTRYFYDSRQNAVDYDSAANRFRLRSYAERNSTTASYGSSYGDFLPFNYTDGVAIQEATEETAACHLDTSDADYWFGMSMEVSFYQSRDGLIGDENMVFRFSGDDDVWVFVDDVLVLDLGGTHGTVEGSIDFATGEILQYLTWGGANATEEARKNGSSTSFPTTLRACFDAAGAAPNGGWSEDGSTFADYTEHKLTFFYLERGAAVANCCLDFRLPTLPDKSLTVTKELTTQDAVSDFLRNTLNYRFRVRKTDGSQELYLTPGMGYTLLENGTAVGTGTVGADGTFSLKAGQGAQFTDMLVKGGGAKAYVVQEIMPDTLTGQYGSVEYTVSGSGGTTKTGEGPTEDFTAFETDTLSAEQTQLVTFRNRVDTGKLCTLRITKQAAQGSRFPPDTRFPIRVMLGGAPLAPGTSCRVGQENRPVEENGCIYLAPGETAEISGILSGTSFQITEPEIQGISCRATYSAVMDPEGTLTCTPNGVTGTFPLRSTVEVTVTNASYDFSAKIPLTKQAKHNAGRETFSFRVSRVEQENGLWQEKEALPGTSITVTNDVLTPGTITLGYAAGVEGIFHYRVEEEPGSGNFLYDDSFYIVTVTASGGQAAVTEILKNGTQPLSANTPLAFVNHRSTQLLITKTLEGGSREEPFFFTAQVTDAVGTTETEFTLRHGESFLLTNIPWGARVSVQESPHTHYIPSVQIGDGALQPGDTAIVTADRDDLTVGFVNRCAYELPNTGGPGRTLYTLGGLLQMTAAACLLYFQRKREQKGNAPADTR